MTVRAIVGLQWGDEGKGKIVDLLASTAQHVVRGQGGGNAGHTVEVEGVTLQLHQIPAGAARRGVKCYLGAGMVIDPKALIEEIGEVERAGFEIKSRLHISPRAHLVLPKHRAIELDVVEKIGTTGKGIGPAYADKALRVGALAGSSPLLTPFLADVAELIYGAIKRGEEVLLEGAQGALLDNTFGTYPYVTSSCTLAAGLCAGVGIGPTAVDEVVGVAKAYTTRVGEGPFPTEGDIGVDARAAGEFGATTGRERRMGWFDALAVKRAARWNGCSSIALTKLDILDPLEEIKVAIGYGEERLAGWRTPIREIRTWEALPENARQYVQRLEELCEVPIRWISVGPERNAIIKRP